MVGLPGGEKILMTCLAVWIQYRRVTDRQTPQASILGQHSARYAYASRGNEQIGQTAFICAVFRRLLFT